MSLLHSLNLISCLPHHLILNISEKGKTWLDTFGTSFVLLWYDVDRYFENYASEDKEWYY